MRRKHSALLNEKLGRKFPVNNPSSIRLNDPIWGLSSVGRAPALHAGGQRFDPARLHHFIKWIETLEYKAQCIVINKSWLIVLCSLEQRLAQANCSLKIWICDIDHVH